MTQQTLKYPIGVQSFQEIRKDGYVYVDKTKYVWDLVSKGKYYFLSRPRRFGKSLLLSTIEAYFQGKKELFEGLAISEHEKEWIEYPVLHFDLNAKEYNSHNTLVEQLTNTIRQLESKYGVAVNPCLSPEVQFGNLILAIYNKFGQRNVVVLVDEYDKPLNNNVDNKVLFDSLQSTLKAFYGVLKSYDSYIKFAMLTGVARFSKVSVFSDLNNLNDISLNANYGSICGITEQELEKYFKSPIEQIAQNKRQSVEEIKRQLKERYDGYHFAPPQYTEAMYNPFSLLTCFYELRLRDLWFESGTSSLLIKPVLAKGFNVVNANDDIIAYESDLMGSNTPDGAPIAVLYQTGYLTIKHYEERFERYILGFPNSEVKRGFSQVAFLAYGNDNQTEFGIQNFIDDLDKGKVDGFIDRLKALISKNPYEQAVDAESTYHNLIFLLFTLLGYYSDSESHMNHGRSDLVVKTRHHIYIFEFKLDESAEAAMRQINERHYDAPYKADGREIVKIGVNYSSKERNIDGWIVEKQ